MKSLRCCRWQTIAAGVGIVYLLIAGANAAEVKVLSAVALTSVLDELAPVFEKSSGNKVELVYGTAGDLRKRILDGEIADVVILPRAVLDDLQKQQKLVPDSVANLGGTDVAVAIRAGSPKPDISSVEALKQTLLQARSVVYSDPAKGGASGVYFARVLDKLGLIDQLKAKTILVAGAQAPEVVAKGDAELGVALVSEIVPVKGAQLLGPLPGELANRLVYTVGIEGEAKSSDSAKAFIQFLKGPTAVSVLKTKGFEPG
jgi:molybdate transport system substrate-binding protein